MRKGNLKFRKHKRKGKNERRNFKLFKREKEASIDELAQGLGKEKAKDFRNLVKTISEMERKRQLSFSNAGKIQLHKKKQMLTLKGTFTPIKMALAL